MDKEIRVDDVNSFSTEVGLHGTARLSDGTCWTAQQFSLKGVHYPSNWLMATIKGRVTQTKVQFDPAINVMTLEGREVSLVKGQYEGQLSTYLWELRHPTCSATVEQVYKGVATVLTPRNPRMKKQVIVKNSEKGVTFALEMAKERSVCGSQMFQSQLSNIFVSVNHDNFILQAEPTTQVDRLDNIIGYVN